METNGNTIRSTGSGSSGKTDMSSSPKGIFDIFDLSSPLQTVYQKVMKEGDATLQELCDVTPDIPKDELKIYLDILSRIGYLDKYLDEQARTVRFKVKGKLRAKSTLPDDIWKMLED